MSRCATVSNPRSASPKGKEKEHPKGISFAGYAYGRYPHSAPGEQAPRSTSGECEPAFLALRTAQPFQIQGLHLQKEKKKNTHKECSFSFGGAGRI